MALPRLDPAVLESDATAEVAGRTAALAALHREVAACGRCVAAGFIPVAHPIFKGAVGNRVMVVGQAPGALAHERPMPYSGASGRTLSGWLGQAGFDDGALHGRCYLTSLTKCFPGASASGKGDRAPSAAEVALCRGHLDRELALVRPELVLALGRWRRPHSWVRRRWRSWSGRCGRRSGRGTASWSCRCRTPQASRAG